MSKETEAQIYWAKCQLAQSEHPFAAETLERIGEVEGVIGRLKDGRLTVSADVVADLITSIHEFRSVSDRCLRFVSAGADEVKPDSSGNEHSKTK